MDYSDIVELRETLDMGEADALISKKEWRLLCITPYMAEGGLSKFLYCLGRSGKKDDD